VSLTQITVGQEESVKKFFVDEHSPLVLKKRTWMEFHDIFSVGDCLQCCETYIVPGPAAAETTLQHEGSSCTRDVQPSWRNHNLELCRVRSDSRRCMLSCCSLSLALQRLSLCGMLGTMILISETTPYENKKYRYLSQCSSWDRLQNSGNSSPAGAGYRKCGGRKNRMILWCWRRRVLRLMGWYRI
jgi:hypothetical protein